jgi:hypothetical protein
VEGAHPGEEEVVLPVGLLVVVVEVARPELLRMAVVQHRRKNTLL